MVLPIIQLRDLSDSGLDLEPAVDAAWLGEVLSGTELQPAADPAGSLRVRLDKAGDGDGTVVLNVRGSVRVRGTCVRCLEALELDVSCTTSLLLEPASSARAKAAKHGQEHELTADELDLDVYHDEKIDLSQWVREQILVELPAHPTHEDCAPPAVEGDNKPGPDPRWAALEKFKTK
jgi:uncharacterized metal-binding protein YceD (DUF177 family)